MNIASGKLLSLSVLSIALLTSACTPEYQCKSASKGYEQRYNQMAERYDDTYNIAVNGYRIHKQQVPYTYASTCYKYSRYSGGYYVDCIKNGTRTEETPVPVTDKQQQDAANSLDYVKKQKDEAYRTWQQQYNTCLARS